MRNSSLLVSSSRSAIKFRYFPRKLTMSEQKTPSAPSKMIPTLRYQEAPAAIEWLVRAFGFEKQLVIPGPDGTIAHAQLKFGPDYLMVGSYKDDVLGLKSPRTLGGVSMSLYIYIPDIDAHHERARDAGAEMVIDLKDTEYGSCEYTARDPEGNLWHFGTYLPE
jgi:uncharacterized glyoxalase superfamily protein PhnB